MTDEMDAGHQDGLLENAHGGMGIGHSLITGHGRSRNAADRVVCCSAVLPTTTALLHWLAGLLLTATRAYALSPYPVSVDPSDNRSRYCTIAETILRCHLSATVAVSHVRSPAIQ